jgi:hypothetical protein
MLYGGMATQLIGSRSGNQKPSHVQVIEADLVGIFLGFLWRPTDWRLVHDLQIRLPAHKAAHFISQIQNDTCIDSTDHFRTLLPICVYMLKRVSTQN